MKLPEDYYRIMPMASIFRKYEHELIFKNILTILYRTQNVWRKLSWEEYQEERLKDQEFDEWELLYFNAVLPYTLNPKVVESFSPELR
jgi:hypothetical protein